MKIKMIMNRVISGRNSLLRSSVFLAQPNTRCLFQWLNVVFNAVDEKKIQQLGPDIAAAEWLIRNGAKVFWANHRQPNDQPFDDYELLMKENSKNFKKDYIVGIDATNSSINHVGFPYLKNLKHLSKIIFNETKHLNDKGLIMLSEYDLKLLHLEIIRCFNVSDVGVLSIQKFRSLQYLKLEDLLSVREKEKCLKTLKNTLNSCCIEWK